MPRAEWPIKMSWQDFKNFMTVHSLAVEAAHSDDGSHCAYAQKGAILIACEITKTDPRNDDQVDYEDNWMPI
jgi:aerobic-type carbon monoxide dehydrogenase small subunit (CoxS/CutS family)